ncbi:hypothetical protein KCG48_14435, partial [Proteiniclasticum sp. BAD-10]|nr:hypothetical protein [Proteiniclasticum sediminis]
AAKVWNETTGQEDVRFRYGYDASGNLGVLEDVVQGVRYRYHYDLVDRLTEVEGSDGSRHVQRYDQNSQLQSLTQIQGQRSQTMAYAYDRDHRPTSVTLSSGAQGRTAYDDLGRITGKTWIVGTTPVQQMNLTYVPVGLTPDLGVQYTGYVENQGWQGWKTDGQVSGTTGLALKYQRVRIALTNVPTDPQDPLASVKIRYRTHVSDVGWTGWVEDGAESGAIAADGRIEAMEIELMNAPEGYHVRYQAHVQSFGWEEPVMDGQEAGTTGQSLRMEALKLTVVKDGAGETTSRVAALEGPGGTVRYT